MSRAWVWLQLLTGWLPLWALYSGLMVAAHGAAPADAALIGARAVLPAALLGIVVHRFVGSMPWPRPFRVRFIVAHVVAGLAYSLGWIIAISVIESAVRRQIVLSVGAGFLSFFIVGIWLYALVAGISYAIQGAEQAGHAEAVEARAQLAALRAQLEPHFLFNALHTIVQLIRLDPPRAAEAAEDVAELLRTTLNEGRDITSLRAEWSFVSRYLAVEQIRFGDRLQVQDDVDPELLDAQVPSFALQTLVENAVRHGAMPRVERTVVTVSVQRAADRLQLRVQNTGELPASPLERPDKSAGTGLNRLRERLKVLYPGAAQLSLQTDVGVVTASVEIPLSFESS
jgi:hypothetical protein